MNLQLHLLTSRFGFQIARALSPIARLLLITLCMAAAGCTAGPDFRAPVSPVGTSYMPDQPGAIGEGTTTMQHLSSTQRTSNEWWKAFGSPKIDALVTLGLENNYDIEKASANLARAQYVAEAAHGGEFPSVSLDAAAGRTRYGASFLGDQAEPSIAFSAWTIGPSLTYDLDLFGRVRRTVEKASALADVKAAEMDAVVLDVSGGIVDEAIAIAWLKERQKILELMLGTSESQLQIIRKAKASGAIPITNVETQQRKLLDITAQLSSQRQDIAAAQNVLTVLVGQVPRDWQAPDIALSEINLPVDIQLALPSALIRQRPDIRAAEANLHASNAALGVATADMYPDITLSASLTPQGLFAGPSELAWNAVGGISAPLFEGGALRANQRAARSSYFAALAVYHQTVIRAFSQISTDLYALSNDAGESDAASMTAQSSRRTEAMTRSAYQNGSVGLLDVLSATDEKEANELKLIQVASQRLRDTARLLQATSSPVPRLDSIPTRSRK